MPGGGRPDTDPMEQCTSCAVTPGTLTTLHMRLVAKPSHPIMISSVINNLNINTEIEYKISIPYPGNFIYEPQ